MALNGTMVAIQTVTVGSGGAANIEFTNIPQTYTDLVIKLSLRTTGSTQNCSIAFNGSTANFSQRQLGGDGSSAYSASRTDNLNAVLANGTGYTATTWASNEVYIPNYTSSNNKSFSSESATENNATGADLVMRAHLWSNTAAITSIAFGAGNGSGTFAQHSTATLYGISRVAPGAKATGGMLYEDDTHYYHLFASSGVFTPTQSISADILVVAGGGSGGRNPAGGGQGGMGGGGAGGLLAHTGQSLTAQNYTVTIGAGGAGGLITGRNSGNNSQFGSLTASIGGGGGGRDGGTGASFVGLNGGSGGGGSYEAGPGTGTAGQGFGGGTGSTSPFVYGGGGGGAGEAGNTDAIGEGGDGSSAYSAWGLATATGENVAGTVWFAGGGGGGSSTGRVGGSGGGGQGSSGTNGNATSGLANTGGGGGGAGGNTSAGSAGSGGSGVVIIRYAK